MSIAIVAYENRLANEVGLKLLVLSVEEHFPDASVHIFAPNASEALQSWMAQHRATLHLHPPGENTGVNVKPDTLLWALDQNYNRAFWIDSDIILSKPLPKTILALSNDVLVASELPGLSGIKIHDRTIGWGLEPGRCFRYNPSSCFMSVTKTHRPLLEQWNAMVGNSEYQRCQGIPLHERPIHLKNADAIFMALLGSKNYEHISLELLKNGPDIAQCLTPYSYKVQHRLMSIIDGLPPVVHAMGKKPWQATGVERIYQSVAPYTCVARRYKESLNPAENDWLEPPKNSMGLWYNIIRGHPALSGLPSAIKSQFLTIGIRSTIRSLVNK